MSFYGTKPGIIL